MLGDELSEPRERRVLRVDGTGESVVARGVLVPDVRNGRVGERGEAFERGVHLCARTLEEDAAAGDEERIAREDRSSDRGRGRRGFVGYVVADRVLRVAGRCKTSVCWAQPDRPQPLVSTGLIGGGNGTENDGLDVEGVSNGELIVAFDQLGQGGTLVASTINRYAREQLSLFDHHTT